MSATIFGQRVFDELSGVSCISRALANSLGPYHGNCVSCPVHADMGQGPLTCLVNLEVVDEPSAHLVLGRDWIAYYREYLTFEGKLSQNHCNEGGSEVCE
jgi:hypothetical protein